MKLRIIKNIYLKKILFSFSNNLDWLVFFSNSSRIKLNILSDSTTKEKISTSLQASQVLNCHSFSYSDSCSNKKKNEFDWWENPTYSIDDIQNDAIYQKLFMTNLRFLFLSSNHTYKSDRKLFKDALMIKNMIQIHQHIDQIKWNRRLFFRMTHFL